jgi:membrane protein YqaA with SNARE-associated domain
MTHNPFFLKYGLVGLFLNGLLSSVVPIPTELTTVALLAGGESKLMVYIVLTTSSIIGGFVASTISVELARQFSGACIKSPKNKMKRKVMVCWRNMDMGCHLILFMDSRTRRRHTIRSGNKKV